MKPSHVSAVTISLLLAAFCSGQEAARYEFRADHHPDGIGKFYMGREIAHVMTYHGASWLDRPEREKEEAPNKLLPALDIKPGQSVADIGAGSGYHTMRLAELVGARGMVYAVDIQKEMLYIIERKRRALRRSNIKPVLSTITDPKLPANSIDLALLVDVYHEFSHPYEMTEKLVEALKPGGRLAFVEFRLEDDNVPIKLLHRMSEQQVIKEMAPHALRHVKTLGHLPWQHVVIFEKIERPTNKSTQ